MTGLQVLGYQVAKVRATRRPAPRLVQLGDKGRGKPDGDSDRLPVLEGSRYVPPEVRAACDATAVLHLLGEGGGGFVGGSEEATVELLQAFDGGRPLAFVPTVRHLVDVPDVLAVADDEELFGVGRALEGVRGVCHDHKIARKRPIVKRGEA